MTTSIFTQGLVDEAHNYAKHFGLMEPVPINNQLGPTPGVPTPTPRNVNDPVDAFRHAYAAAVLTKNFGATMTEITGWANENLSLTGLNASEEENSFDYINNSVGVVMGEYADKHNLTAFPHLFFRFMNKRSGRAVRGA